jgi:hypothetical protein
VFVYERGDFVFDTRAGLTVCNDYASKIMNYMETLTESQQLDFLEIEALIVAKVMSESEN